MSLDSTFGRTAFPCFSGLPTGVWDLLATLHGAHFVAFIFHAVHFDDAGQPCVPEGVNREEWLPFILGTALNRSLPCSESGSEDGDPLIDTTDDDEPCEAHRSACHSKPSSQVVVSASSSSIFHCGETSSKVSRYKVGRVYLFSFVLPVFA